MNDGITIIDNRQAYYKRRDNFYLGLINLAHSYTQRIAISRSALIKIEQLRRVCCPKSFAREILIIANQDQPFQTPSDS